MSFLCFALNLWSSSSPSSDDHIGVLKTSGSLNLTSDIDRVVLDWKSLRLLECHVHQM